MRVDFLCVYPKVESWSLYGHGDCCSWDGVECDDTTGHVIGLDLRSSCLFGTITSNSSLFRLLHLESLNLAWNDFNSSSIPYGFGNLSRLQYLNLSNSHFSGKVPLDIPRISRLISLDLSFGWDPSIPLDLSLEMPNVDNFVHNLTMLRELDLSFISMPSPFPHVLANFSSLKSLKLRDCGLHGEFPIGIFQLPNLEVLDISLNDKLYGSIPEQKWGVSLKSLILWGTNFSGEIPVSIGNLAFLNVLSIGECDFSGSLPTSLGNLSQLAILDISASKFHGQIPASFANLTQLSYLDLSVNNFSGDIWHWLVNLGKLTSLGLADVQLSGLIQSSFENLTRLINLDISFNNLQGEIPNSLGELKHLEYLCLSRNNLSGTVDIHKLKDLEFLDLSWNNLSGIVDIHEFKNLTTLYLDFNNISFVSKNEVNCALPKLSTLALDSCNLHEFPKFLGYLSGLETLSLSHNNIGGSIPSWMWNGGRETLKYIDLSHNFLTGFVNNQINLPLPKLIYFDISSNLVKTALPSPPPSVIYYNISNNFLFGEIQSICKARSLAVLDLSINSLNGTIPSCFGNIGSLSILSLGKNKLEGMIPNAYPKGCVLKIIDLIENRLQGPVPISLANCTKLEYLNLGYNQILDGFPFWLSVLTELKAVILKSNMFHGPIETYQSQFNFSNLHILDLSNNSFNGELPSKLLQSFHAMKVIIGQDQLEYMYTFSGFSIGIVLGNLIIDKKSRWFLHYSKRMAKKWKRLGRQ
ncbi:receptor-like protein 6 [Syzygium oleosum]|uniref:receptor-like protein 6 n=1 Tax=Syzygium oleosum TaxID=219896 RepID=UPI0024BAA3AA|nr:receptor-like protein 6 [Syzygium oleosum]